MLLILMPLLFPSGQRVLLLLHSYTDLLQIVLELSVCLSFHIMGCYLYLFIFTSESWSKSTVQQMFILKENHKYIKNPIFKDELYSYSFTVYYHNNNWSANYYSPSVLCIGSYEVISLKKISCYNIYTHWTYELRDKSISHQFLKLFQGINLNLGFLWKSDKRIKINNLEFTKRVSASL